MILLASTPLTSTFLVAIRLGIVLLFTPIEAVRILPISLRLMLLLLLSVFISTHSAIPAENPDSLALFVSSLAELCNGLVLSCIVYATFAVFSIAGQLIDAQMGLNALAILNPSDHSHDPLGGRLLSMAGVLFFFALDGHHQLLRVLLFSFTLIAPGQLTLFNGYAPIMHQCALMWSFGLIFASPILFSLLIIDLAGAVFTRNTPQINTYFLTLPVKILLGLFLFESLLNYIKPFMHALFNSCFVSLQQVMP